MTKLSFVLALPALLAASAAAQPALGQTMEQMAGQMIVVGFAGDSADDASVAALREQVAAGDLGGVMYLKTNVESLSAVAAMNAAFREASPDLPPLITLDQEGGAVERLTDAVGFKELPSAERVAASHDPARARALYGEMARAVADLGFTVNFAPVVDLNLNPDNQIIAKYGRAFGETPEEVIPYARALIEAHHDAGLLTALKHFPGHGSSTADSHEGFVDITRSWQEEELEPYRVLAAEGLIDLVMVGHLINTDYSELPASLSREWITDVLRYDVGFDGVVITDDLEMGAIRDHFSLRETVLGAVRAGADVLLFSNTTDPRPTLAAEVRAILVEEAEADPSFQARIEESYGRIVALKSRIGS